MLAIASSQPERKLTPHVLPCTIHHNGPLNVSKRYWNPKRSDDGSSTAYFRGRSLRGITVKLPEGYEGRLLQKTEQKLPLKPVAPAGLGGDDDEVEEGDEVRVMQTEGTFDEVVVWGHEVVPGAEDEYVKGIEEWMKFGAAVDHTTEMSRRT